MKTCESSKRTEKEKVTSSKETSDKKDQRVRLIEILKVLDSNQKPKE